MFGFFRSPKSSTKLDPIPLGSITPGIVWEGCGTGRAYVVYVTKDPVTKELQFGMVTFNQCASISCALEKNSRLESGSVHDLNHSRAWRALSPGLSLNLGLSALTATTWREIRHFKIPFGSRTVNIFATDFSVSKIEGHTHISAMAHCIEDLRRHHDHLDQLALDLEEACGGF